MLENKDLKPNPVFEQDKWSNKHILEDYPEQRTPEPEEELKYQREEGKSVETKYSKEALKSNYSDLVEICFLCDCTGSMGSFIAEAKKTIFQMIVDLKEMNSKARIKISFVGYLDHSDNWITDTLRFTDSQQNINRFIDELYANGGGDFPEAVVDGLYAVRHLDWSPSSAKILIHILDAPPHGREFSTSGNGDNYPDGCPCGYDYKQILSEMYQMGIQYNILNCTEHVDKMVEIFTKYHPEIYNVPMGKGNAVASAAMADKVSLQTQNIMNQKFGWEMPKGKEKKIKYSKKDEEIIKDGEKVYTKKEKEEKHICFIF